ncbi:phenylalanyl-tRNA synthetase, alpha subunit [Caminicella sporogenes DSM 14501]|uniref:Phenylalanine--tRNA ligase alpha subunit n=1 Tax=Caminicella sporogenes DSM 14501 TaxID=1121266 RepID=A0A1M6R353_9FIRM|nr:phenylalanine--tRNA ligase subunit alpha [Caminicella sporogenes]RKD27293.1 phenylalanine--tRNA ligase subunit alpha [Caminicella sporogenes]WIF94273.1 phenylalanine--tRNA ligase subunit alpha [Caminicella sporogenes]SHK26853.1 phenylalanyl-tRNA synthetase, alpha subunit [Caminicella sporogenes DSM 14501]
MKEQLQQILENSKREISSVNTMEELEQIRIKYLGKKGKLTLVLREMGKLSKEERPVIGKLANEVRQEIERELEFNKNVIKEKEKKAKLENEVIDVTMPGKINKVGHKHPLTLVLDEIQNIFIGMGFKIAEGPEIETVYHNFDALNAPKDHPSRDLSDTFYISEDILLRTQTSPVQVRVMQKTKPPIRIISPGRCYRFDEIDATHSPMFHQIEGLVVDKGITFTDLKGTLDLFAKRLFGIGTKTKFRPHYFPFTEPSAEVDVSCFKCGGKGCRMCKGSGWIEILGCGMVHPNVLKECGIDPEIYSGFAFGMGLDRITMLKLEIDDIRHFFDNDMRFIEQF